MATLQFKVRLGEALHSAIKRAADENNRSVNSEIVHRLQRSFDDESAAVPTRELRVISGLGVGERDYDQYMRELNEKIDNIKAMLERKGEQP